jgi:hypothetical protein
VPRLSRPRVPCFDRRQRQQQQQQQQQQQKKKTKKKKKKKKKNEGTMPSQRAGETPATRLQKRKFV